MKRVLVIGDEGFIGSALRDRTGWDGMEGARVEDEFWWVRDCSGVVDEDGEEYYVPDIKLHKIDVIVNLAGHCGSAKYIEENGADVISDNSRYIMNLYGGLREAGWKGTVVNLMANCMYPEMESWSEGLQEEGYIWEGPPHPSVIAFAETRRLLWVTSHAYEKQYGVKSANFICGGVYGPGDHTDVEKTHMISGIISRMKNAKEAGDEEFLVWGSPNTEREWIFIDDLVDILEMIVREEKGEVYPTNIGTRQLKADGTHENDVNSGFSTHDIATMVVRASQYRGKLVYEAPNIRQKVCGRKVLSLEKSRRIGITHTSPTPMDVGIQRAVG